MHVATTRRRHGPREYTTTLVRQSYRKGGKVRHRTLANLSHLPEETVELVRASSDGTSFVPADEALQTLRSLARRDVAGGVGAGGEARLQGADERRRVASAASLICSQVLSCSKAAYATW
jgi:hypothetical protein